MAGALLGRGTRTAIHAGYGIYYEQLDYMGNCCDAAPIGMLNYKVTISSATFPIHLAPNAPIPGAKVAPAGVQPDLKMPAVQQYSFRIEQGITANMILRFGYVGEHGYHLLSTSDVNTSFPSSFNVTTPSYPP